MSEQPKDDKHWEKYRKPKESRIFVGMQIGIMGAYLPMSYEFDDGIVRLDDWQIRFLPQFAFTFGIPK